MEAGEKAITEGQTDIISMGRKMLTDLHLPRKLTEGKQQDIRACIYCYTCISAIYINQPARCAVNLETGFEHLHRPKNDAATRQSAEPTKQKTIAVLGGGPGGMGAARRLDLAGHKVVLFEETGNHRLRCGWAPAPHPGC